MIRSSRQARPVLMLVFGHEQVPRPDAGLEVSRRFGSDYEVVTQRRVESAEAALVELRNDRREVAVLLTDQTIAQANRSKLLSRAGELHPHAQRGVIVPWGERSVTEAVRSAAALGQIEFWAMEPWRSPDETFLAAVGDALRAWSSLALPSAEVVKIVGEQWSARSHEVRDLLRRNNVPHGFYPVPSTEGEEVLDRVGDDGTRLPVVIVRDEQVLVDPTNPELARALGVRTRPERDRYDVTVVGAGPSGLAAAVSAASEGLSVALLEREAYGGQAGTTSLIRNYLGFPSGVSGNELAARAYEQAWLFGTEFVYGEATGLHNRGGEKVMALADGGELRSAAIVLATGVSYRRLRVAALDALGGTGVFYGAAVTEAEAMAGRRVFVVGGGNSAGQAAVHLARFAEQVTLLVRGPSLAESMSDYLIRSLDDAPNIDIRYETEVVDGGGSPRLEHLTLTDIARGHLETVPASALFVLIGAAPRTDWLPPEIARDRWGYLITGQEAIADKLSGDRLPPRVPMPLETSLPGVFAVGDVRHGSVKRVASAVGEGSVSVRMLHLYLSGEANLGAGAPT